MDALNYRQARFVEEYVKEPNPRQAYIKAGYEGRGNVAYVTAFHLLRNPKIAAAINKAKAAQSKRIKVSADRVLEEAARLAFFDIRQLYDADGKLLPVSQWPDDAAAAVSGLDSIEQWTEDGALEAVVKKVRMWSKPSQLKLLAQHLRLLGDEPSTVVNVQVNVKTSLSEAFSRAYGTAAVLPSGSGPAQRPDDAG